jgi:hypothetical protein
MRFWIVALAAVAAGQAQAATEQFDLVCRGTVSKGHGAKPELTDEHYRVDLAKGQWCGGECTHVRAIAEVTPSRITFDKRDDPLKREYALHLVERTTGEWYYSLGPVAERWTIQGQCEPAPFTGINPQVKF